MIPKEFDTRSWLVWLISCAGLAMLLRNPWYSFGFLLITYLVRKVHGRQPLEYPISLTRVAGLLLLFSTLFNMLSVHVGGTILFHLPASWPWIGGPITLEAAAAGFANGLLLLALLTIFSTFNQVVSTSDLARLTPRAFRDLGVVVIIAVTAVPETVRHLRAIREAQAIRGYQMRGLADWPPVLLPLLVGGLERAMGLAEMMIARGYGAVTSVKQPIKRQIGLLVGLTAVFSGWTLAYWVGWPGWLMMASGGVWLATLLWRIGRQIPHTRYQSKIWSLGDSLLVVMAVVPWLVLLVSDRSELVYSPFPNLIWPVLNHRIGAGLLFLLFPIFWRNKGASSD